MSPQEVIETATSKLRSNWLVAVYTAVVVTLILVLVITEALR